MKRLCLLLATAILFVSASVNAQGVKDTSYKTGGGVTKMKHEEFRVYGEVKLFSDNGRTTIKVHFDALVEKIFADKETFKLYTQLENYRYESLNEALNVLASYGWSVDHVWTIENRTGVDTHFLISKTVGEMKPLAPWANMRKSSKEGLKRGK